MIKMRIFPPPGFFNTRTLLLTYLIKSTLYVQNKYSEKNRCTLEDEEYAKCSETSIIKVKGDFVTFTKHFKSLGSYMSYSLQDDYDIDARLAAVNASMGSLSKFLTDASVNNRRKYLIFLDVPINMLLWGCEIWALRTSLLKKLEVFLHRSIRRILGISTTEVKYQRITNETIRRNFLYTQH